MKLSELIKTVKVKIPNTDLEVEIKTEFSWCEQQETFLIKDQMELAKYMLSHLIVDWNLQDDNGVKIPITEKIVSELPEKIVSPISTEIEKIAKDNLAKKKV